MKKCFKCGSEEGTMRKWLGRGSEYHPIVIVRHHINYNFDMVVDCCQSCHRKIHQRIRRENACPLSVKEIRILSTRSYNKDSKRIEFNETLAPNISFRELIKYNSRRGNVLYSAYFHVDNRGELYEIPS